MAMLNRVRVVLAAAGLAASGAVAGLVVAAGPASAAPAAGQALAPARVVLVSQCTGKGQVRPRTVPLPGCMISSELIGQVSWTSWRPSAFGRGDLEVNNCTPSSSCGPSQYTRYPVLIVAWRSLPWAGGPRADYFSRITLIFTGKRPPHAAVTRTIIMPPAAG